MIMHIFSFVLIILRSLKANNILLIGGVKNSACELSKNQFGSGKTNLPRSFSVGVVAAVTFTGNKWHQKSYFRLHHTPIYGIHPIWNHAKQNRIIPH